jgi:hypothetical protein
MSKRVRIASLAGLLGLAFVAYLIFGRTTSSGIPDVGEPFDVAAFASRTVSDDQNAFTLYGEADRQFVELANADVRDQLAQNQKALAIWRRGSERSAAMAVPLDQLSLGSPMHVQETVRKLIQLALLEAERESTTKPHDAWPSYRACLRSSRHLAMNAAMVQRLIAVATWQTTLEAVQRWSQRPERTAVELKQALGEAEAISGLTPPFSECLKAEYLTMMHERDAFIRSLGNTGSRADDGRERIRRLMNLLYANWLSQADQPRPARSPLAFKAPELYQVNEATVSDSRLRDPAAINRWFSLPKAGGPLLGNFLRGQVYIWTSSFFVLTLPSPSTLQDAIDREATYRGVLILDLALQAYRREHAQFPTALEELVKGGYLKALPPDPFAKGQPLRYRRQTGPDAGAVVWSVWYDGIDQDGHEAAENDKSSPGDKVFGIAVPKAATSTGNRPAP